MTVTSMQLIYGPASAGRYRQSADIAANGGRYHLDDSDDSVFWFFTLPKTGSITKVGFYQDTTVGSPPVYSVSVQTVAANKVPSGTPYGGSAITDFTPGANGWKWTTLSTPATATIGDFICAGIQPKSGGTAPTGSNYIGVLLANVGYGEGVDEFRYFSTVWNAIGQMGGICVQYSDGVIVGIPATNAQAQGVSINASSTPDEVGAKFTVPVECVCSGAILNNTTATTDWPAEIKLYNGANTLLTSFVISANYDQDYDENFTVHFPPVTLAADTVYRLTFLPTGTTSGHKIRLGAFQMQSADDRYVLPNGLNFQWTQRTDAGSWTDDNTRLPYVALLLDSVTIPEAGGGGGAFAYSG